MRFDVLTLFPDSLRNLLAFGVVGRALETDRLTCRTWDIRDYAHDRHRTTDDRPFGGGPGMVLKPEPLDAALADAREHGADGSVVLLSPQGQRLHHGLVEELAQAPRMILVCGRYEGIDQRWIDQRVDREVSIGDYVLSGGELPAAVLIDALARTLEGVLGHEDSAQQDSFANGLLDCPHFTRPATWNKSEVPAVLLSGDHGAVARWRREQALMRTLKRRPDLIEKARAHGQLTEQDEACLGNLPDGRK